jgi:hypothetical protein
MSQPNVVSLTLVSIHSLPSPSRQLPRYYLFETVLVPHQQLTSRNPAYHDSRWVTPAVQCWKTLCKAPTVRLPAQTHRRLRSLTGLAVDRDEVERIRKRFMKLDKVRCSSALGHPANLIDRLLQDNSGTIEREEFLSLPQISSNPLATRLVARSLFSA